MEIHYNGESMPRNMYLKKIYLFCKYVPLYNLWISTLSLINNG